MAKTATYKTDDIVLTVSREPNLKRTEIFLYLLVPKELQSIQLVTTHIRVFDKHGEEITNKNELDEIFNSDKEQYSQYQFESTFIYQYVPFPELYTTDGSYNFKPSRVYLKHRDNYIEYPFFAQEHWESFDYFLMGKSHTVRIVTPRSEILAVHSEIN